MTNYNERLDKALERLAVAGRGWGVSESAQIESMSSELDETKQAILRWVADEVIGEDEEETIEDKLGGKYRFNSNKRRRNRVRRSQRKILAEHGYKGATK